MPEIFQADTCPCNNVFLSKVYLNWENPHSTVCELLKPIGVPVDIKGLVAY